MTATRIGCDNAVGALIYEATDGTPTFGPITPLPGLIKLTINPNTSAETLFADDGPGETASTTGKIEVEIEKANLSTLEKAFIFGHAIDINGSLVYGASDVPPWLAIGFRTMKGNGTYRYVWLYKGKFIDGEDTNETKGDSINFQTETIKGNFVRLDKSYTVAGKQVKPYKLEIDEEHPGANVNVITQWFSQVILPGVAIAAPVTAPVLSVVVAQGAISGTTKATITGTATNAFAVGYGDASRTTVSYVGSTPVTTIKPYTSGGDIAGISVDKYLYVYDLDTNGKVVKYFEKKLILADIK
jgi:phi13 family phage major tail protein